ncbi:hypothetical protein HYH02_014239 [Chlamydomonas schloesseri]|uniref:Translation initiation factor IF-3 n=1 Tax=Chlamydomonas schloesseri TaxID=2026947 RepID=A0A835SKG4_9CHLO|nr:hypothetical protein HYH02_014239 [Chlamydomonas schloesseri]|eukprot:KAG2428827.1 hypothetical protein HYH02_014239 [Chlamydomonas schloesseri]
MLARGGTPLATSRAANCHQINAPCCGPASVLMPRHAKRQALLPASSGGRDVAAGAGGKKRYQDFGSTDSLDLDSLGSLDSLDGAALDKYQDLIKGAAGAGAGAAGAAGGAGAAGAAPAAQGGAGAQGGRQNRNGNKNRGGYNGGGYNGAGANGAAADGFSTWPAASSSAAAPAQPGRAPMSFSSFDDDFAFEDTPWTTAAPLPPAGGGGGYMNGGGGGGYMNGGGGGGYMNGGGYGGYTGGGYGGGYTTGGGYSGGGYMNGGGGYSTGRRSGGRNSMRMRYDDLTEDLDETEGEMPVVKVDRAVINGKTLQANHGITVKEVFVLGAGPERNPLGTMPTSRAQALADEAKEDLLLINPDASPPVARIISWSKYKYELEKGAKERKAKSTQQETKEVRLRPSTDSGDIAVKLKSCQKFLSKGDRVKLVMKFEGRELQFREQGKEVLLGFISELASVAKVEGPLNFKTGTYTIMLSPTAGAPATTTAGGGSK